MMTRLFLIIFVLLVSHVCFAQQQYTFTNYKEVEGLPSGLYWGMFKDTTGFLWLYSEQGIARFDGYNFKVFRHNPDDSTSIPSNNCRNAMQVTNGDIYFNMAGGSRLYDPRKLSFTSQFPYKDAGEVFYSYTLKSDNNALYLFSANNLIRVHNAECDSFPLPEKGYYRVSPAANEKSDLTMLNFSGKVFAFKANAKRFDQINIYDRSGMLDTTVFDIFYREEENNFIAISKKHLYRFSKNPDRFIPSIDLHQLSSVELIYWGVPVRHNNNYFVCTANGKLYKLNIATGEEKIIHLNKKIPENKVKNKECAGVIDQKGILWIRSFHMGLFRYDISTDQYEQFINEPGNAGSLPSNDVYQILPDNEGMAWIGCRLHGLVKMEPLLPVMERLSPPSNKRKFVFFGNEDKNIRTFLETESGYLVGTLQGLFSYDEEKKAYSEETRHFGPVETQIGSLERDLIGNTWVGTWSGQLRILNPENNRHISFSPFRRSNIRVRDLFCDSKNTMWIATQEDGIYTVNANEIDFDNPASLKFNHISHGEKNASTISSNIIYALKEDADGNIWAGADNGLNRYDRSSKKWTRYANIPGDTYSIHGNDVRSLAFDKKGTLWIGTNGGGLNRYNKAENNFTHFTKENGLPNDAVYTILCDNNGMLWLGTNHGLCRFNPDDYSCKNFTLKDGLQNYEFNTEAALKLKDGRLLFGGVDGYNVIDPAKIENIKSLPPPVVISAIKIFDREVPPGDGYLNLKYTENSLTFEFAALSFYRNQDNRYAYKMEGIDPDWIYSNDRRYVTYSNIEPGDYIFKVKARNSDGVWNETGTQLAITIRPPWWASWWAYLFYLGILAWVSKAFYQYSLTQKLEHQRSAKLREIDEFKSRFFTNITHEFRTPLTVILGMSEQLANQEKDQNQIKKIGLIKRNGDNLLRLINQILDLSKLESNNMKLNYIQGDILAYIKYICESLHSLANAQNILLRVESDQAKIEMDYDPDRFLQIMYNLLSNAIKFTPSGGKVMLRANLNGPWLHITVTDTGTGIPEEEIPFLFERFFQAKNQEHAKAGGSGIGLALTSELVKVMGGEIQVESKLGTGTTFLVKLPVTHLAGKDALDTVHEGEMKKKLSSISNIPPSLVDEITNDQMDKSQLPHILIIEDNPDVIEYLTACLQNTFLIVYAFNGQAGIEKALDTIPDIIVSDVMMPIKDGFDVLETLKHDELTSHIPIVLLTAKADIQSRLIGLRKGADAYLSKPFHQEELLVTIENLLDSRRLLQLKYQEKTINQDLSPTDKIDDVEDAFLQKFRAVVEKNLSDPDFEMPQLERALAMSRSQIYRKIKALTDKSPSLLIRSIRLHHGRHLLLTTQLTVSEIAYDVGYNALNNFSDAYLDEFGERPMKTRGA